MTVLIKGMEMPKNCGECQFGHFTTWCCLAEREDIFYDAIPEWCPLEESKTGKWVKAEKHGVLSYTDVYAMCDQCHKVKFNGWGMNYCPSCGARMNKGGEDE